MAASVQGRERSVFLFPLFLLLYLLKDSTERITQSRVIRPLFFFAQGFIDLHSRQTFQRFVSLPSTRLQRRLPTSGRLTLSCWCWSAPLEEALGLFDQKYKLPGSQETSQSGGGGEQVPDSLLKHQSKLAKCCGGSTSLFFISRLHLWELYPFFPMQRKWLLCKAQLSLHLQLILLLWFSIASWINE